MPNNNNLSKSIRIRLTPEEHKQVKQRVLDLGITVQELVRLKLFALPMQTIIVEHHEIVKKAT